MGLKSRFLASGASMENDGYVRRRGEADPEKGR